MMFRTQIHAPDPISMSLHSNLQGTFQDRRRTPNLEDLDNPGLDLQGDLLVGIAYDLAQARSNHGLSNLGPDPG